MSESKIKNFLVLFLVSVTAAMIYQVPYLKYVFYDALIESLGVNNAQLGDLSAVYGAVAMVCFFFGGIISDKFRVKDLLCISMVSTGALILWYATLPSYNVLLFIFGAMGFFSGCTFWAARQKAVRLLSSDETYSTNQGVSSGIYGLGSMVSGFVGIFIIGQTVGVTEGVVNILVFYGVTSIACGIACKLIIPSFNNEISAAEGTKLLSVDELKEAARYPIVWLVAVSVFSVYSLYICMSYTTPYLTNIYGASDSLVAGLSSFRSYGVVLFSVPLIGILARKIGSTAQTIVYTCIIAIVTVGLFLVLPKQAGMLIPVVVLTMISAFFISGAYGIYFAQLGDGKLPVQIFGAATGLISIIGYSPDVFIHPMVGGWLDKYPGIEGYNYLFYTMIFFAIVSVITSSAIIRLCKKNDAAALQAAPATA